MSIDREQQRANRRKKRIAAAKEDQLNFKNEFGVNDPVPFKAIINIINKRQRGFNYE